MSAAANSGLLLCLCFDGASLLIEPADEVNVVLVLVLVMVSVCAAGRIPRGQIDTYFCGIFPFPFPFPFNFPLAVVLLPVLVSILSLVAFILCRLIIVVVSDGGGGVPERHVPALVNTVDKLVCGSPGTAMRCNASPWCGCWPSCDTTAGDGAGKSRARLVWWWWWTPAGTFCTPPWFWLLCLETKLLSSSSCGWPRRNMS